MLLMYTLPEILDLFDGVHSVSHYYSVFPQIGSKMQIFVEFVHNVFLT